MQNLILRIIKPALRIMALISALVILPALSASAQNASQSGALVQFFAGQGCAIGPSTRGAAVTAGFGISEIEALEADARANPDTVITDEWLVLAPEVCRIELPNIHSRLRLSDPEVAARLTTVDAYAEEGSYGCFFTLGNLFEHVAATRGWDEDTVNQEYLAMLAAGLVSGELAFYSEDPLATPYGFMLTTGECATVPSMARVMHNHGLLIKHFGALVRENAAHVVCEPRASIGSPEFSKIAARITGDLNRNEWLFFEIQIIAMGAGWYEGLTMQNRGLPRPPLCHFEDLS